MMQLTSFGPSPKAEFSNRRKIAISICTYLGAWEPRSATRSYEKLSRLGGLCEPGARAQTPLGYLEPPCATALPPLQGVL
jgi:hypothetical protein